MTGAQFAENGVEEVLPAVFLARQLFFHFRRAGALRCFHESKGRTDSILRNGALHSLGSSAPPVDRARSFLGIGTEEDLNGPVGVVGVGALPNVSTADVLAGFPE